MAEEKHLVLPARHKPIKDLKEYVAKGGIRGLKKARLMKPEKIIANVTTSGLRGRGGAGFPAGKKWETVARADCERRFVVCNAAEGEPGTYKDRHILQLNPYQVLEGVCIASLALKAPKAIIGIKEKFTTEIERLESTIEEMEADNIIEKGFIELCKGPDDYLFGEEKGLMEVIDGRPPRPRVLPPYTLGVGGSPEEPNATLVNNVETFAHIPPIFSQSPDWYLTMGTKASSGTMVITLSGDVKNEGLYEIELGLSAKDLIEDYGGGTKSGQPVKAVFSGAANGVITADKLDTPLDFDALKKIGSGLGSGGFIVYDESACMVKAAIAFSQFLFDGSCGQCVPCITGTEVITDHLKKFENNKGSDEDIKAIMEECNKVTNEARCYLAGQEAVLVPSVINAFKDEFTEHIKGECPSDREIVLPKIENYDTSVGAFILEEEKNE